MKNVGALLAGAFAAEKIGSAILDFSKQVIDLGSHLVDLRAKTGISLAGLQTLKIAAEQNGTSLEQVATGANKLGIALAGGGKDVQHAVKELGLNFALMKTQTPEKNLADVSTAFDKIENPAERAKIAMSLFGKSGIELLPILNGEFGKSVEAAKRLGLVISDDLLVASDKFGDQMVVVKASLTKLTAEALTPLLPGLIAGAELLVAFTTGAVAFGRALVDHVIGAVLKVREEIYGFAAVVADVGGHIPILGKALGGVGFSFENMKAKTQEAADAYRIFTEDTKKASTATDDHASKTKKALPSLEDWSKGTKGQGMSAHDTAFAIQELADHLRNYTAVLVDNTRANVPALEANKRFWTDVHALADQQGQKIIDKAKAIQEVLGKALKPPEKPDTSAWDAAFAKWIKPFEGFPESLSKSLRTAIATIPQTLSAAFTGGGGLGGAAKALGTQFGAIFTEHLFGAINEKTGEGISGLAKGLSGTAAKFVSALGPIIGSALTPLVGFLSGKLNQGGGTAAQRAVQDLANETLKLRNAFLEAGGSLSSLQAKAAAAGTTLVAVLNAKTPEAYTKAINELNAAFKFQDDAMATLDATVEKYGFSLSQLGPTLQNQRLGEQAATLYQDFEVLKAGGIGYNDIIKQMGPNLRDYIIASANAGVAIPKQFEPIVKSLQEQGLLTGDNGEALVDLTKLKWSEDLEGKFQSVIDKIGQLVDAITRGLYPAIINTPAAPNPYADWPTGTGTQDNSGGGGDTGSYGARGGVVGARGIQYLAGGGMVNWQPKGIDRHPAMLAYGEGVLSTDGMAALGSLNRGITPRLIDLRPNLAAVEGKIDALTRALVSSVPAQTAAAVKHAVQTSRR